MSEHGTKTRYTNGGCRCDECRQAMREYHESRRAAPFDRKAMGDLLHELCPDGLTDDCPARRARAAAA